MGEKLRWWNLQWSMRHPAEPRRRRRWLHITGLDREELLGRFLGRGWLHHARTRTEHMRCCQRRIPPSLNPDEIKIKYYIPKKKKKKNYHQKKKKKKKKKK